MEGGGDGRAIFPSSPMSGSLSWIMDLKMKMLWKNSPFKAQKLVSENSKFLYTRRLYVSRVDNIFFNSF